MLKKWFLWIVLLYCSGLWAQEISSPYKNKKIVATLDTIRLDSVSINPGFFKLIDLQEKDIDTSFYKINFQKGTLIFNEKAPFLKDTLRVRFLKFPDYLTKEYSIYDQSRVVSNQASGNLYRVTKEPNKPFTPFDGLSTSGNITRGLTVGNNQNAVVNSALDLQITGKLSDNVSIRASIQDNNIPLQSGGYSQKLDEFDQVFIELYGDKWNIRGGDLFLENRRSSFLNFNKKAQGVAAGYQFVTPKAKTTVRAAGALSRGQYSKSTFIGQEGNQGPYKLKGPNGELYVLVVSGSERVYVNGILLKRGENNHYTIDYNAGEIIFTSLFPITSEMRINIEYQYSDRNYTRFLTYGEVDHEEKKWSINGAIYSESDVKNQPIQQTLSPEQVEVLAHAGDNPNLMVAPSAYVDTYSENKILYKKTIIDGVEVYEFSKNPDDVLYNVKFSLVGYNKGNYILSNANTIDKIHQYIAPENGIPQGNYEPVVRLIAPTKIQIATISGKYNPSQKTDINYEFGLSNNDLNLYSNLDDSNNTGTAGKINAKQSFIIHKWQADIFTNYQFVQQDFKTIERLYSIEFNRDWNLTNPQGNQSLLISGINFNLKENGFANYQFEKLDFSENFSGNRHVFGTLLKQNNLSFQDNGSALQSDNATADSKFFRNQMQTRYHLKKNWAGVSLRSENNQEKNKNTGQLSPISQKFNEYGLFVGRGDSTKVFVELGYLNRINDSLQNGLLKRVNQSKSYYLNSRLLQTAKSDLSIFVNYRNLEFEDVSKKSEPSLNSRLLYNDRFFNQIIQIGTTYENTSGTIAQQEFTYVKVDPGKGVFTWNDYNGNGIQELDEFETAKFKDEAIYIRVFLPNQIYQKTHKNKFSQSLTLNPAQWQNKERFQKLISYFYNQTSILTERKTALNENSFNWNPFGNNDNDLLGMNSSFRNNLYFNRGKQQNSVIYSYIKTHLKNLLTSGSQENSINSHQLQYIHLYQKSWLFDLMGKSISTATFSENYAAKNYRIETKQIASKLSYLFNINTHWDLLYDYSNKINETGDFETLNQQKIGTSFTYSDGDLVTVNGEFSLFQNKFNGNTTSAVAFQMLEGLQNGNNILWRVFVQRKINRFFNINFNYEGRKTEIKNAIHLGNLQLMVYF